MPGGAWVWLSLPSLSPRLFVSCSPPADPPDDRGHLDMLIKQYPGGKQSSYLHSLQPGDSVTFFRIPGYSWTPNEQAHVAVVAGGQGITPCYQLLRNILRNPADHTKVTLVWGVNTEADLFLADELAALQKQYPDRLTTHYVVSQPSGPSDRFASGRVTAEVLKKAGVATADGVGKVFMSGPPTMEKAMLARGGPLAEVGFAKKEVHKF